MIIRLLTMLCLPLVLVMAALPGAAQPAGWMDWTFHAEKDGVQVSYRIKIQRDDILVQWKCYSHTSQRKSCSIGAGEEKTYVCTRGSNGHVVGETGALGERATVMPYKEYVFPSESACQGLNADYMKRPIVKVSIENE